ncbi:MAG: hypothetical protein QG670_1870 [Thermoproteota archaeon]|nr:hypothetical protein [Thermoproteota archaeon]
MYLLGLDIGTSGCKSFLYSPEGEIISSSYHEYTIRHPKPTWSELEPTEVLSHILATIRESVGKAKIDPKEVQAISISALGDEIMPVDKNLNFCYPTLLLYDQRAAKQMVEIPEKIGTSKLEEITGSPRARFIISNIMWLKEEMPEVYKKAAKLIGWHEYVVWKLCGKPVIDPSLAQATGVFDRRSYRWSNEVLDVLGLDADLMPEIQLAGTAVGEVTSEASKETGLTRGTAVVVGAHDTPDCSALGAGVVYENLAMDLTGTFENVTTVVPKDTKEQVRTLCWGINKTSSIYISGVGGLSSSGSVFKWYKDTFSQDEIAEASQTGRDVYDILTAKAAQSPPGSNNLLVIPDFTGRNTRGAIIGLTLGHRKNDIIRAFLEGITFQIRIGLENAGERAARITEIRAVGGGGKSPFWVQLKADIYKKKMVTPAVLEAGSLGAAILAGIGVGVFKDAFDGVNRTYKQKTAYYPNEETSKIYDRHFKAYKRLRQAMDPAFKDVITI